MALLAGGPAGERGVEIPGLRPLRKFTGVGAIGFAGVTGHAPVARLPKGHDRRAVFITREQAHTGGIAQVGEIVAADRWRLPRGGGAQGAERAGQFEGGGFLDEGVARHSKGVLREDAGDLLGTISEIDVALAAFSDVFQKFGIHIAGSAKADNADGDAGFSHGGDESFVIAGFLGILGIGKQDDMPVGRRGFHQHLRGGLKSLVHVDAAAHGFNLENFISEEGVLLAFGRGEIQHRVRGAIHGDHAEFIGGGQ